jgi:nicotinamidase-related amidase
MKKILKRIFLFLISVIGISIVYFFYFNYQAGIITKGNKIPVYDNSKSALLVVDIQEATTGKLSNTDQYIQKSESLINKINEIVKIVAANNILIIYIYTESSNWFMNLLNDTMEKGSLGTKVDSRLNIVSKNILSKGKMDSFSNPDLDDILIKNKISKIYFVGLDPAYCINNTIAAAQSRGYKPYVIKDAIISEYLKNTSQ